MREVAGLTLRHCLLLLLLSYCQTSSSSRDMREVAGLTLWHCLLLLLSCCQTSSSSRDMREVAGLTLRHCLLLSLRRTATLSINLEPCYAGGWCLSNSSAQCQQHSKRSVLPDCQIKHQPRTVICGRLMLKRQFSTMPATVKRSLSKRQPRAVICRRLMLWKWKTRQQQHSIHCL